MLAHKRDSTLLRLKLSSELFSMFSKYIHFVFSVRPQHSVFVFAKRIERLWTSGNEYIADIFWKVIEFSWTGLKLIQKRSEFLLIQNVDTKGKTTPFLKSVH